MTDGNKFVVYKSSAGSGKTYTLVKEYLKIVLANPDKMHEVLAITFTNAAAAQMKGRIIKELASISNLATNLNEEEVDNELLEQIMAEYSTEKSGEVDKKAIVNNAGKVLEKILHSYSDFSVSTIDSFVHRIIRSFAFDLQVPLNFEVESDANRLLSQAVDMVIAETGSNKQLTQFLVTFVSRQAEEDKSLGVEKMIGNLASSLMGEGGDDYLEKLQTLSLDDFLKIEKGLANKTREIENILQKKAIEAMHTIKSAGISSGSFYQSSRGIYPYLERLSKGDFSKILPNNFVKTTLEEDKWASGKASQSELAAIEGVKGQLQNQSEQIIDFAEQSLGNYQLLMAVSSNIFPLGVLNEVKRALEGIKKENAILHFSDFNKKISKIVAEQPVPFIYERVGERYKHYMIDEFQDTSILQWQNLLPLVDNGLSTGNKSLIVGDGKQAIYRWRGGEVEQFVNLPNIPDEIKAGAKLQWQNSLQRNYKPEFLVKNWRSREKVIEFNNRFFDFAKQYLDESLQNIYQDVIQDPAKKGSGGFVQISFLQNQDYTSETLDRVLKTVAELQQAGHPLGDIAILCRSNKNGSLIAKHLMLNKKPVISPDSLLLNQSDEVVFIVSLLKLLSNKNDVVAACEAVNFLLQEKIIVGKNLHDVLSKSGLFPVFSRKENTNWQFALKEMLKTQGVDFDLNDLRHLSVYDATEQIARTFFADKQPSPFVNFFIDHLLEYSEKGNQGVSDFVNWWNESSKNFSVVTPEGIDAVRVMSIHKSKGLEFPVVIYPFASISRNKPTKDGFWVSPTGCEELEALPAAYLNNSEKNLEGTIFYDEHLKEKNLTSLDNMNLFYVALTRAEEKLFVFSKDSTTETATTPQFLLKSFVESNNDFRPTGLDGEFSFGENWQKNTTTSVKPNEQIKLERLFSRSWSDSLRVASKQESRGGTTYEKRERGKLFHGAMEKIITVQDIQPVLQSLVSQGQIDETTANEWEQNLSEIISQEDISECFLNNENIKTEPGLFDENGNFWRPDRVVFLKNKTVVIDYKSGQEHPNHKHQVDNYAAILQEMGYDNVKKYLLYLDEPSLVKW